MQPYPIIYSMESIHVKMETIENKIMALKDHKAWGPDDINLKLLNVLINYCYHYN